MNSQEWTASRGVTELRVGVLGSPDSGKSALVHRYLTGAYMQEESPEGLYYLNKIQIILIKSEHKISFSTKRSLQHHLASSSGTTFIRRSLNSYDA